MKRQNLPGLVGFVGIISAEISLLANFLPVREWFYPIIWWSYILFIDGLIYLLKNESLIITRTKSFLGMLPWSIAIWLIFELYNLRMENWYYVNVTPVMWQRWLGYALSYATVLPGIFETAELLETFGLFHHLTNLRFNITTRFLGKILIIGVLFIVLPVIFPKYSFPLVWVAFIFALEPINHYLGQKSLLKEGDFRQIAILFTSGLVCGILWEFWNYWARTKWVYALPYFHWLRIFEMPLLGYLGFLPFAWECYAMYQFSRVSQKYPIPLKILTMVLLVGFSFMTFYLIDVSTVKTFIER